MFSVFRWLVWRRLAREWRRASLTVLGVALGVSVFVAIRLASGSSLASFTETVDAVRGRAELQVSATGDGFDERLYARIRREPGVTAAAPVVEVHALAAAGDQRARVAATAVEPGGRAGFEETLLLLGLDPFAERPFGRLAGPGDTLAAAAGLELLASPGTVMVTRAFAARAGLAAGDTVTLLAAGAPVALRIVALLGREELQQAMGGNVALADLATVQELFARGGRLDRVDLIVEPGARDGVQRSLASWLPAAARAESPRTRTKQVENLVRAFSLNLLALSFIAIFVSTFLIFNAVALAVVRQRHDIGVWRALGLTRGQVLVLFLGEGLLLGTLGGALGAALGGLLANAALAQVGRTLETLYLVAQTDKLWLDPGVLATGIAIGVLSSLVSSLAPALEAAATPAAATLREGSFLEARRPPYARLAWSGVGLLVAAGGVTLWTHLARAPLGGFVAAFLVLAGFSLLAPAWTRASARLAEPLARRAGIAATLGVRAVEEAAARASVVIAALMVAVGMLVALTVMVGSFRRTVDQWVTQTLRGDLYVEPVGHRASLGATSLPAELVAAAARLPGVVAVDTYRATTVTAGDRLVQCVGIELAVQRDYGGLAFSGGEDPRDVLNRAISGGGVAVTESFAHHQRLQAGDSVSLPSASGPVRLRIEGVFQDYSTDAGAVLMDRSLYERLWPEPRTESLALYLAPGASSAEVRAAFLALAGPARWLYVTPNQALRRRVLAVFDETFRITWALQGIAVTVAVLGVVSTLTALVLQRRRELATLRAVGARRSQLRTLVLVESALLGFSGSLLGCGSGLVLALLLVHVINRQFFGWTIQLTLEPGVFTGAVVLMTLTATLAGLLPARIAVAGEAAGALRTE
ncbi:MAG TPA: FtsX-like permease family protein [Planctomycetota bacterium]|nr:FtsX-like permease family protein [Planctomycetota bacterium]